MGTREIGIFRRVLYGMPRIAHFEHTTKKKSYKDNKCVLEQWAGPAERFSGFRAQHCGLLEISHRVDSLARLCSPKYRTLVVCFKKIDTPQFLYTPSPNSE